MISHLTFLLQSESLLPDKSRLKRISVGLIGEGDQPHRQIVGVVASLYVDESLVRYAERSGLIVLSFGDEGMDLRNTDGFAPRLF